MGDLLQDFRYSFRQLRWSPGFTAAAVLCIALGIGANSATFSFANSLLLYQPPVRQPDRLVRLFVKWASGLEYAAFSFPDYVDFRDRSDAFTGLVAETPHPLHLSHEGRNQRIWGSIVSGNYFSELGIELALGRGFNPEEYRTPGTHAVAVLGHSLWQSRFGSDPDVLGKQILLNGHPFTVVGVTQEGFHGTNVGFGPDLWVPLMMQERLIPGVNLLERRSSHWILFITGRLRPGVTLEQARESTNALMGQLIEEYPDDNTGKSIQVFPETEAGLHPFVRGAFAGFIGLMFGVVGLILFLACANVAGLLLARSAARRKEIGIRLALGASRLRLVRQLLTESALLALLAGGVGLLLGFWLVRLVATFEPPSDLPLDWTITLDVRVLAFTFVAAVITGVLFGLVPALQATRQELVSALKDSSSTRGPRPSKLRQSLVVCQVGLSLILLISAGLVVRSLQNVKNIDPGFDPDKLLIASVEVGLQGYDEARGRMFYRSLKERIGALPGVESVGLGALVPLSFAINQHGVRPEGYELPEGSDPPFVDGNVVDNDYFDAMRIPVLRGGAFTEADTEDSPPVMIINETFAKRFWPGEDPIGKQVRTMGRDHQVIGMVKDGKYFSIGEDPKPYFYRSLGQSYTGGIFLHVRTAGDPGAMLEPVRQQVRALDETLPVADLKTMNANLGFALLPARLAASVVTGFAVLALMLAAIGLYGVIAYSVSQGVHDIGVRMALGARAADVVRIVVRQGLVLTVVGVAAGLVGGLAVTRLMTILLYGVSPNDAISYLVASLVLAAVALLASFLPARRAARVDPMTALREE